MSEPLYTIVTVCTHYPEQDYFCLKEYAKSLNGEPILVLDAEYTKYSGLGSKPKGVYRAIKEGLIKTEYIIFTDCFDFVFAVPPKELFEEYLKWEGHPLVFSAEKNCFPADLMEQYDALDNMGSSYKYLNSGMIIGKTADLLATLEAMDLANVPEDYRMEDGNNFHVNDQFLYQQIFLKQPVKMELDYAQALCNTLHSVKLEELNFDEDGIYNKECSVYPLSFHLNGSAKTDGLREPILNHLKL